MGRTVCTWFLATAVLFGGLPGATIARPVLPTPRTRESVQRGRGPATHAERCACRVCPAGKACCCQAAGNVTEAVAMSAACEVPLSASLHNAVWPALLPLSVAIARAPARAFCLAPRSDAVRCRPTVPEVPPPELL